MPTSPTIERWRAQAESLVSFAAVHVPLDVLIGESMEVAKFVQEFWEPEGDRPGLRLAGAKLPASIADDILSLREAVQDAQTAYRMALVPQPSHQEKLSRGAHVLRELEATLEWHLDDGVDDDTDLQLSNLSTAHKESSRAADRLAQALHDFATLAQPQAQALDGLGGFDAGLIDEAFTLARALGEVQQPPGARSEQARAAIDLRNRLARMLLQRMGLVRRATRFVFRAYPPIIRRATSAWERRRRADRRRTLDTRV